MSSGVPSSAEDCDRLRGSLVGVRRDADIQRLSLLHRRVQRAERFLERRAGVETVVVEDVDVVDAEALEALVEAGEQVLARAEVAIGTGPHVPAGFRRDHQLIAVIPRKSVAEDATEIRLGAPVRRPVVVRKVEVRDAEVERSPEDGALALERSIAAEVVPQPQRQSGKHETAAPAAAVLHRCVAVVCRAVAVGVDHNVELSPIGPRVRSRSEPFSEPVGLAGKAGMEDSQ